MEDRLTISIDRDSRKWAVFRNNFDLVHAFTPYDGETFALAEAQAWCATQGDNNPKVVYPRITSMRVTTSKARNRKKVIST